MTRNSGSKFVLFVITAEGYRHFLPNLQRNMGVMKTIPDFNEKWRVSGWSNIWGNVEGVREVTLNSPASFGGEDGESTALRRREPSARLRAGLLFLEESRCEIFLCDRQCK